MCSHRLAAVLDELHSAVRLVLVNFLGCMVEQRRGGRHRRSGGGVANRRRHMAAAPRPDPVGPEPAIDEIAGGAGGGHADGWCRSCGLRSADLVALGFVRLLRLYEALRLEMTYDAEAKTVSVTIRPMRRASERVRGGT